ncbi:hypothetical protein BDQ94DRAFT_4593 [Aspergillus welwitschiae]|uniref:Uncharacterized protein n=1 Tax=Aspergillus welwitschiae TaxID=1341132 RepID=A0A3F3QJN5_9EURO|nr:hypothetical protein BDQ94DRAFT_4593 [Aspergillus welwitschiae]RDH39345.1 hypothetical protein BDQ94DRAFT_4593 [Aspergillus welwitschiae]
MTPAAAIPPRTVRPQCSPASLPHQVTRSLQPLCWSFGNNNNNTPHVSKMASFLQHLDLLPETSQKATAKYDDSTRQGPE